MGSTLYILPHQLYHLNHFVKSKHTTIILWEHPDFFTKYNFNKKKLVLHRASMQFYKDLLEKKGLNVRYIEFDTNHEIIKDASMFDPINDIHGFEKLKKIESPNFLVDRAFLHSIYDGKKSKSSMSFTRYFYPRVKDQIDYLQNVTSKDNQNRKVPDTKEIHKIPKLPRLSESTLPYIEDAIKYVQKHFSNNYGNTNNFNFPISHKDATKWCKHFIKLRLKKFGDYQDAIIQEQSFMYHSVLSSSINIGLINPSDIIQMLQKMKARITVEMNNLEGYVRQLIWREFQRYCYIYLKDDLKKKNRFKLNTKMSKEWYDGTTGILPLDETIKKAFDTSYLHHIERLMIMGNLMLLHKINKEDGFKWFMEFAIDSYEWVMYQNVYDMVFYSTGGKTSYKPYLSSSKYILRMSNYKKGEWSKVWDVLYKERVQ